MKAVTEMLDAALALFAERGLHATPTAAITKKAGVSTGLLFHHFKNKDELIVELFVREKKRVYHSLSQIDTEGETLENNARKALLSTLEWMLENATSLLFIQQIYPTTYRAIADRDERLKQARRPLEQMFEIGRAANVVRDLPVDLIEELIFYQLVALHTFLLQHPDYKLTDERKEEFFEMVWRAVTY